MLISRVYAKHLETPSEKRLAPGSDELFYRVMKYSCTKQPLKRYTIIANPELRKGESKPKTITGNTMLDIHNMLHIMHNNNIS